MHSNLNKLSTATTLLLTILFTGCIAPLNSVFDSAKLLDKGEFEVQGNYSKYYDYTWGAGYIHDNYGVGIGYGLTDQFGLKLRYERGLAAANPDLGTEPFQFNIIELSGKFEVVEDKIAFAIPITTIFSPNGIDLYTVSPRFLLTYTNWNNRIELNFIPKAHVFIGTNSVGLRPGVNLGFGFSSDLSKWAVRPEIGYDGYLNFGIGTNIYIGRKIKNN